MIDENDKFNIVETFSGIGAQHKALSILFDTRHNKKLLASLPKSIKEKFSKLSLNVVATSDWDIYSNISYDAIHNNSLCDPNFCSGLHNKDEMLEFLSKFNHSLDGKTPASFSRIQRLEIDLIIKLFHSYKNNNNQGDISKIDGKMLIESIFKFSNSKKIDLLTYSFPCQDLSVAGHLSSWNSDKTGMGMARDSNTRSGLLWQVLRILKELKEIGNQPKYLLLENVVNMISSQHIDDYKDFLLEIKELGYSTETFKLSALDFGIPQSRRRVYGLSTLQNDNSEFKVITSLENVTELFNISTTLEKIIDTKYLDEIAKREANEARPNDTTSRRRMWLNNKKLVIDSKVVSTITKTITTRQDRQPCAGVIDLTNSTIDKYKPENIKTGIYEKKSNYRYLTCREQFLLMGFSELDFIKAYESINGNTRILEKQIGNSIVVNVLVSVFYKMLKSNYHIYD